MSATPFDVQLTRPTSRLQPTKVLEQGTEAPLPRYAQHLLCDDDGLFPDELKSWETHVQSIEMQKDGRVGWYRNPPRTSQDSLGIVYDYAGETLLMHPDFLFFSVSADGEVTVDIVDPHGDHLADSLPKLCGLANFVEKHGAHFGRIEGVAKVDGNYRVLNLKDAAIRDLVRRAGSSKEAYRDALSGTYS